MHLLQRYLLLKYRSDYEVNSQFVKLTEMLKNLWLLSRAVSIEIAEQNLDDRTQLFREVFDNNDYVNNFLNTAPMEILQPY